MGTPVTLKDLLTLGGYEVCGYHRQALARFLDDALLAYYEAAVKAHGGEDAAVLLYMLFRQDPRFRPPTWALYRLRRHRAAVLAAVGGGSGGVVVARARRAGPGADTAR